MRIYEFFLEDEFGNYKYYTFPINCEFRVIQPLIQQYTPEKYFLFLLLDHFIKIESFPLNNKNICKFLNIGIQSFYNYVKEFQEDGIFIKNVNSEMRYSFGNFYNEIYKRDDEYYNRDYKSVFEYEPYLYEFPILGTLLKKLSKIDYFIFGLKLEGINMGGRRSLNDIIPKYFKFSSRKVDDSLRILLKNNLIEISLVDKPGDQRFVGISADNYITFIKKFVNQESLFQQKLIDDTKQKNMRFSKKKI